MLMFIDLWWRQAGRGIPSEWWTHQSLSFSRLFGNFKCLRELNLFLCRNLHSIGLELIAEHCQNLEHLNIDEINYLTDESVNFFIKERCQTIKYLWIDGESLSDKSFSNLYKMVKLEILSISFADNMGPSGILSIGKLENLGKLCLAILKRSFL